MHRPACLRHLFSIEGTHQKVVEQKDAGCKAQGSREMGGGLEGSSTAAGRPFAAAPVPTARQARPAKLTLCVQHLHPWPLRVGRCREAEPERAGKLAVAGGGGGGVPTSGQLQRRYASWLFSPFTTPSGQFMHHQTSRSATKHRAAPSASSCSPGALSAARPCANSTITAHTAAKALP